MPASMDWRSAWIVVERAYTTHPLGVRGDALCGATAHPHPSPGRPGPARAVRAVRRALIGCVESEAVMREITATEARPQLPPAPLPVHNLGARHQARTGALSAPPPLHPARTPQLV